MVIESFKYATEEILIKWPETPAMIDRNALEESENYHSIGIDETDCTECVSSRCFPCLRLEFILKRELGYFMVQVCA